MSTGTLVGAVALTLATTLTGIAVNLQPDVAIPLSLREAAVAVQRTAGDEGAEMASHPAELAMSTQLCPW